ncbi:hypothetical protein GQ44DRAFT_760393 [Phaeosphaeriaceae sp. PMI808]|nr:hypothetical protein GQ44DRAFT_760393 [Phaeosphaeriaceae sp. PMI808]
MAGITENIPVDYSMPPLELNAWTCQLSLQNRADLSFLAMGRLNKLSSASISDPYTPSWVPDLYAVGHCQEDLPELGIFLAPEFYNAATNLPANSFVAYLHQTYCQLRNNQLLTQSEDVVIDVSHADDFFRGPSISQALVQIVRERFLGRESKLRVDEHAFNFQEEMEKAPWYPKMFELALREAHCMKARILVRSAGDSFGHVPLDTQQDDLICVFKGCHFPVILRKIKSYYIYIGPCFMFGMMDGELVNKARRGELQEQTFIVN